MRDDATRRTRDRAAASAGSMFAIASLDHLRGSGEWKSQQEMRDRDRDAVVSRRSTSIFPAAARSSIQNETVLSNAQ